MSICNNRLGSTIPAFLSNMTALTSIRLTLKQCDSHCTCKPGYYCYMNATADLSFLQCTDDDYVNGRCSNTRANYTCRDCEKGSACLDGLRVRPSPSRALTELVSTYHVP